MVHPAAVLQGALQPLAEVAEPAHLGKVEGDKSQPGHPAGAGHGQVSTGHIQRTQNNLWQQG